MTAKGDGAMQSRFITPSAVIFSVVVLAGMIAILACPVHASVLETARINVGSNFSTCLGPWASTDGGAEAVINCGGQQTVTWFPLPALLYLDHSRERVRLLHLRRCCRITTRSGPAISLAMRLAPFVPGVGHVVDMTLPRAEQVPFTPGQVVHLFDQVNWAGHIISRKEKRRCVSTYICWRQW